MTDDPIVAEVRKARHAHAARFNFDLDAIVADLRSRQGKSGHKVVSFAPAPRHGTTASKNKKRATKISRSQSPNQKEQKARR